VRCGRHGPVRSTEGGRSVCYVPGARTRVRGVRSRQWPEGAQTPLRQGHADPPGRSQAFGADVKVGFLTADWSNAFENDNGDSTVPGGSAWYRCINPGAQMSLNGFEVVIAQAAAISSEGLILVDGAGVHHDDCDVVVMQRIMNDFGVKLVECARKAGQKVVNDVDDWYWGLHPANQAYLTTDPRTNPKINSRHY